MAKTRLKLVVIAAPNNNPFEFWSMHKDKDYDDLMMGVQRYIDDPHRPTESISQIFTQAMYDDLRCELLQQGASRLADLDMMWSTDLKDRDAVDGFLKDPSFGEKRLISMPERITSSLKTPDGRLLFRPSPITGYDPDMSDPDAWWAAWKRFMFRTAVLSRGKPVRSACALLDLLLRPKYPALTAAEEAASVELQALCLAVFDAVLARILFLVAPSTWQPLRRALHAGLFADKPARCVALLAARHARADVIFIQEASEAFAARAGACLDHAVLRPARVDGRRSQLSLILLSPAAFDTASARDLSRDAAARLPPRCAAEEDLCVFEAVHRYAGPCLLASFHGDSDGRTAGPVLAALHDLARDRYPGHLLLLGIDANTASRTAPPPTCQLDPAPLSADTEVCVSPVLTAAAAAAEGGDASGGLSVEGWEALLAARGLSSCWAGRDDAAGLWTTFSARTLLQPQVHKAVAAAAAGGAEHRRLRDWVVFPAGRAALAGPAERDNTGRGALAEVRTVPSAAFPSDHAVVSVRLAVRREA